MSKKKNITKNAKQAETSKPIDTKKATQATKQFAKQAAKPAPKSSLKQDFGLLVTKELQTAINKCSEKVNRIAKECRASNRKFRCVFFTDHCPRF